MYSLAEAPDGTLWIGTEEGGLNRMDPRTGAFIHYRHDPDNPAGLSSNDLLSLLVDRDGTLWVGTWNGGLNHFDPATGTASHYRHDPDNPASLIKDRVYALFQDARGTLWVGSEGGGLSRFDPDRNGFHHFLHDPQDPTSLSSNDVMSIMEDRHGILWVGTYGGGLNRFDPTTQTFTQFTEVDGLANNVVYGILDDDRGHLWMSTNRGLSRFDPRAKTFRNYDVRDGLQSNEFNSGAYHHGASGRFYFGGINGFNAFFPDQIHDNPYVPPVVLTAVKKFNEKAFPGIEPASLTRLTLGPDDTVFSLEFAALNYTVPGKNTYSYRLEGFNDDWIFLATKRDLTFTNLDPGTYTFRVRAANNDGVWNMEGLTLALTITPPLWQTWWFRVSFVLTLGLLIFVAYQVRTRRIRARNRQLEAINQELESKNTELERFTYTVSHDLKSPLVTIKGFLGLLEKDLAREDRARVQSDLRHINRAAEKMDRLLNELLELSRVGHKMNPPETVPLTTLAREALEQVAGQIRERNVDVTVPASLPAVYGDRTRLLEVYQNLIDNAVKFMGTQPTPVVELGARQENGQVVCYVRDNGMGIEAAYQEKVFELFERLAPDTEGTGIGLALARRIIEMHGGRIWVESRGPGAGSTFYFTLPSESTTFPSRAALRKNASPVSRR